MDDNSDLQKVYLYGKAIGVVEKFCYFGDTIQPQGEASAYVIARSSRVSSKNFCYY